MAKTAKKKRPYTKRVSAQQHDTPLAFDIETSPPPAPDRSSQISIEMIERLKATMPFVKPGQAFIIPKRVPDKIKKYLKENYPKERFTFCRIPDDDTRLRIYWLKPVKQ